MFCYITHDSFISWFIGKKQVLAWTYLLLYSQLFSGDNTAYPWALKYIASVVDFETDRFHSVFWMVSLPQTYQVGPSVYFGFCVYIENNSLKKKSLHNNKSTRCYHLTYFEILQYKSVLCFV